MKVGKKIISGILLVALYITAVLGSTIDVVASEIVQKAENQENAWAIDNITETELGEEEREYSELVYAGVPDIQNPIIVSDNSLRAGQKVTYDCVWFGSYPQTELVLSGSEEETVLVGKNQYFTTEYISLSSEEFSKLKDASYDSKGDAIVTLSTGTYKIRRIKKSDATSAYSNPSSYDGINYYKWASETNYHYFRYDPIKWRVLSVDSNGYAFVRADKGLDIQDYNSTRNFTTWEDCTLRGWINNDSKGFYKNAFNITEQSAIKNSLVENKDSLLYGTAGGNDTYDNVFLLSESEVSSTDEAVSYGFVRAYNIGDEARRIQISTYAFAMGSFRSTDSKFEGNGEWRLRSPGYYYPGFYEDYITLISYQGREIRNGSNFPIPICPALNLNIASSEMYYAGTVCTNGTVNEIECPNKGEDAGNMQNPASDIKNPGIVADDKMKAGQKVTYDCIWFGTYPQTELVLSGSKEATALSSMNKYSRTEYEAISSADYNVLTNANYDSKGDATVTLSSGKVKIRRIKQSDATHAESARGYYNWVSATAYHYFRFDPIKWRVLSVDSAGNALVRADKGLDAQAYNSTYSSTTWKDCTIRTWLNTDINGFYYNAFDSTEQKAISTTIVNNTNNLDYGTSGGKNTYDSVFLLSESEVYGTDNAISSGFVKSYSNYDEARQIQTSTYAHAMGAYRSAESGRIGNSSWWLRSLGCRTTYAAYVRSYGYVDSSGFYVNTCDYAICPALNLNLSSSAVRYAGTVCTDGTVDVSANSDSGEENVNPTPNSGTEVINPNSKPAKKLKAYADTFTIGAITDDDLDKVYVFDGNKLLTRGVDYRISVQTYNFDKRGKVKATVTGMGNYAGELTVNIPVIEIKSSESFIASATGGETLASCVYIGKNLKFYPSDVVVFDSAGNRIYIDYSVSAKNNKDAGYAIINVKGKGKTKGSVYVPVKIAPTTAVFSATIKQSVTYNGKLQSQKLKATSSLGSLRESKDYILTYKNNLDAGDATVVITGIGNYEGQSLEKTFTINPLDIKKTSIKKDKSGNVTITYNKHQLVEGIDYDVTDTAKNGKLAKLITGKKNFTGSVVK